MRSLDYLRGYYVQSPRWVQRSAGTLLTAVPPSLLYGRTFRRLQADIERSETDAVFVEAQMRSRLATLFSMARETRHYAKPLAGLSIESPALSDLMRFPILEKEEVRRNVDHMLAVPKSEMDEVTTGGTSSWVPLSFYLDKDRSVKEWAFLTHLWQRCGYQLGDRMAVLGYRGVTHISSPASKPWDWEPGTRELRLSPLRMVPPVMDEYLALIRRYRVAFIYGYPSAVSILAAHARNGDWSPPPTLKGVLLMSESIRPVQRQAMREGFGSLPILAGYGLSEKVAIAGETPARPGEYTFEPLYGVTELVDPDGSPVLVPGQRGRLVGTGLLSMGMPLIRYDTGDLATAVDAPSRDNCWRLRVRDITSRHCQDYLVTREGGLIAHTVLYPHNQLVRECQFVQDEPGVATLLIVPQPGVDRGDLEGLRRTIDERADGVMTVTLEMVDEIPLTARGKRVLVHQHLDLSEFGLTDG